ncbi:phage tail protein [Dickeya dianthicola]|uniref:Phage tail protein n=1 Tax=Dickeya dianthicola TaxID=204039 RepID=A0AAX1C595_9GAMM|nr:phage tail protein [Dickeya dianthicola]MCA7005066.1 phage tail protein [Dickeya dianthicola]MCI4001383.1 phage tail protein [Dickeya dianthicola]MCI4031784.1 phage tail protein [Dickeya dianthicola]MCI4153941.1 phage tail protein [Dickeya dianthicola]MCI4173336.1 phage tail protein [Dickeya dianthicola]
MININLSVSVMMALGLFVFGLQTVPYQELQRQRNWRHVTNSRIGQRPSWQFIGPDSDTLTLQGVLLPEITGGRLSLLMLEKMAESGKAWSLIEGTGTIYGMYVIESLSETRTLFFFNGSARRIEFTITLKRVDGDFGAVTGSLSEQWTSLKDSATGYADKVTAAAGQAVDAVKGVFS